MEEDNFFDEIPAYLRNESTEICPPVFPIELEDVYVDGSAEEETGIITQDGKKIVMDASLIKPSKSD